MIVKRIVYINSTSYIEINKFYLNGWNIEVGDEEVSVNCVEI